ncbi:TetR/AcrR family transcriptional regulator [Symbioplanes lichenis]|uniref:TetR/AcrR family transcriptional regulator n=1 Tax=Symbioplanes lichenis TaxID=1629072 RepID=UPI0027396E78|nr:TetR/AcrR family transcriptional regulator [Actinoplanes lichenis]
MAPTRQQIIDVAAAILESEGVQAVSTRTVATAAGIRAASLYQLFGDKDGLLEALALHAFDLYLAEKSALTMTGDPIDDVRRGWDMHVDFGLRHPALYVLMFGTDRPGRRPPAVAEAESLLLRFLERIAAAGRLRVPVTLAAQLAMAAITGATLTLIGTPEADRDPQLAARMRDTLVDSLITDPPAAPDTGLAARALALDAALAAGDPALRPAELALLRDWLDRLAR